VRRTPIGVCVLAVSLMATLYGCAGVGAGPAIPPGNDWTTAATSVQGTARAVGSRPAAAAVPVSKVPAQRRMLKATLGIQVYWNSAGSQADMAADANRIFNYVVQLGANSVAINFFFFTDGEYPTHVYGVPGTTPSPAIMAMVVRNAREHGLRVLLRPLLNEKNIQIIRAAWRGSIEPHSVSSWFRSYYRFLKPYFIAAQVSGANGFNIGAELDSLAPDEPHWTALKAAAAKLFKGKLVYAVNYGRWQEDPPYEPVPDAAVDAYPLLGLGDSATVTEITDAWVSWLHHEPESVLRRTVLQEVGIAAASGAYAEPALVAARGTPLDVAIQRKWFAAACAAARETRMAGIYFYAVNSTDHPSDRAAAASYAPGSFIDRSDGVIKACFASGWS
jgi:Glycoside Hydrolase Family 113